jgi:hypothetical protein
MAVSLGHGGQSDLAGDAVKNATAWAYVEA